MKKFIQKLAKEYNTDYDTVMSLILSLLALMFACFSLGISLMNFLNLY